MSRISWSDDEDHPGQFELWQANCLRSLHGKKGQSALRELEAALVAMPVKALVSHAFVKPDGAVCAIGALAVHRKVNDGTSPADAIAELSEGYVAPEDDYGDDDTDMVPIGVEMGMPRLVAWKVVEQNDIINDVVWERHLGPIAPGHGSYKGGVAHVRAMTPEERYDRMLAWVRSQLKHIKAEGE